jgi:hypothetical protein
MTLCAQTVRKNLPVRMRNFNTSWSHEVLMPQQDRLMKLRITVYCTGGSLAPCKISTWGPPACCVTAHTSVNP